MSSTARAERLDAVCGADELRHDDKATEHEHHVEDPRAEAAEVEQGGDGPGAGERGPEHLRADKDGGADNGNDVKPDDAAALGHAGFPLRNAMSPNPAARSSRYGISQLPVFLASTWLQKVSALAAVSVVTLVRALLGGVAMATMWRVALEWHTPFA